VPLQPERELEVLVERLPWVCQATNMGAGVSVKSSPVAVVCGAHEVLQEAEGGVGLQPVLVLLKPFLEN
jgi:hypothetical protein